MQKFYFDSNDGIVAHTDLVGVMFQDGDHALAEASQAMGEMCRDYLPGTANSARNLQMTVRNDAGCIYQLSVTFCVKSFD